MSKKNYGPEGPHGQEGLGGPEGQEWRNGAAAQDGQGGQGGSGAQGSPDLLDVLRGSDSPDGPPMSEESLRRLLHTVVDDIEPAPGSLEHLRRAVPARRTRKRQALVGAAAAVLLVGTAVPAAVHVAQSSGAGEDRHAIAGHGERAQGGVSGGAEAQGKGDTKDHKPSDKATGSGKRGGEGGKKGGESGKPGGGAVGGVDPAESMAATSPACTRGQLGGGTASSETMDGSSTVYGSFQVTNVSGATCAVDDGGLVFATAQGSADEGRVQVVDHTAGDPATELPDPATQPQQVILRPGAAYEVKFAWIPAEGGSGGCPSPGASPDPGDSGGTSSTGEPGTAEAASPQAAAEDPGTQSAGSVALSHTPKAGGPAAAGATITNTCAGTLYRTGAFAA
ncbi:hypothetical protein [Streptomyces sp. KR80]|uniref:hypothetical protein n=1 Tax=Streptomyces sp. KR80 TaxID=3457426 RepID=UPI003FD5E447